MSLKLPRKQFNKPNLVVQGRLRRYSDRMISSCKDLASECAVSCLLYFTFYLHLIMTVACECGNKGLRGCEAILLKLIVRLNLTNVGKQSYNKVFGYLAYID